MYLWIIVSNNQCDDSNVSITRFIFNVLIYGQAVPGHLENLANLK